MQHTITVNLTGTSDMLMHNVRLANPMDPYTRALKEVTSKRKKTDDDHLSIMDIEARGGCYETVAGDLGLPDANVWASIQEAAKGFKLGAAVKRALVYTDAIAPLSIGGQHVACDVWLKDPANIDYRPVVVSGRKTMRSRPRIPAGWQSQHTFVLLTDELSLDQLTMILERSGSVVGVGDYRPTFGKYAAEVVA